MKVGDVVQYAVIGILLLAVAGMLFGYALGQPVLLGYVETGSMEPTISSGDGFIAVPTALTGPPESGDVVVFQAEELQGGGLTTHRIVERTDDGYITQGDANPFTDQDGAEPPVSESQIKATALQINGNVVVVPGLGTGVTTVQGLATSVTGVLAGVPGLSALLDGEITPLTLVFLGSALIVVNVVASVFDNSRTKSTRSRRRPGYYTSVMIFLGLILIVLAPATMSMLVGSGATTLDIVSSQSPNDNPMVIKSGETSTMEYGLTNDGYVPMLTILESSHPDVAFKDSVIHLPGQSEHTTELTIQAPEETGAYNREITNHRYLPVLPQSVILELHAVHPLLAIAAINTVLLISVLAVSVLVIGVSSIRIRSTKRNISVVERFKRRF